LILDSDIEILPTAVLAMTNFMETHPEVGVIGPQVLFPDLKLQHSCNKFAPNLFSVFLNKCFFFANLRYKFYRTKIGNLYLKVRYKWAEEFVWLGGMCLLARMEVIQQLKGMDENFFIYYDDTDFCLRARNAGWRIYYLPQASVIHHLGTGVGKFSIFLFPKIFESELYFFRKHHGRFQEKICAILIQLSMFLRFLISLPLIFLGIKREYFTKRLNTYWQVLSLASKNYAGTH
jgi:GT2 family glycosyltransferase